MVSSFGEGGLRSWPGGALLEEAREMLGRFGGPVREDVELELDNDRVLSDEPERDTAPVRRDAGWARFRMLVCELLEVVLSKDISS